jgi:tetratricopeptide (TPR) repeat protein
MPYYTANPGEPAVAFFRKLVEADPKAPEPRGRLAHALVQLGRFAEAEVEGKAALALDPADQWALYALALAANTRYDAAAARGRYERLLATDFSKFRDHFVTPDYIRANLADLLRDGRRPRRSSIAKAAEAENPAALKLVDRFYLRTGRVDRALAVYDRILAKRPDDLNALVNLGVLHLHAGSTEAAIGFLDRAWKRNDRVMKIAYFLHRAHHRAGHALEAADWLARCAAFDPKEQAALDFRADLVSPYPCSDIIRQCAAAAAGDAKAFRETQESLFEQDEEDAAQGAVMEEGFLDRLLEGRVPDSGGRRSATSRRTPVYGGEPLVASSTLMRPTPLLARAVDLRPAPRGALRRGARGGRGGARARSRVPALRRAGGRGGPVGGRRAQGARALPPGDARARAGRRSRRPRRLPRPPRGRRRGGHARRARRAGLPRPALRRPLRGDRFVVKRAARRAALPAHQAAALSDAEVGRSGAPSTPPALRPWPAERLEDGPRLAAPQNNFA